MAHSFESVRLLICDPNPVVRSGLKGALFSLGFRSITDTGSFMRLHDLLAQDSIDLLITASEVENRDAGVLIQEMRHQRLGTNPFVVVIMLLANPDPDSVRKVIDTGTDDVLLMPIAPEQLFARIQKLTTARKPFVVTHDYIGPDRRSKTRAFAQSAPILLVPNLLKSRMQTGMDSTRLNAQIRDTSTSLKRMKLERDIVQVDWLANHIGATIREGTQDESLATHTALLVRVAEDILRRLEDAEEDTHQETAKGLLDVAHKLDADPGAIKYADLQILSELPKSLAKAMNGAAKQPA